MAHSLTWCLFILLCAPLRCGLLAEECERDGTPSGLGEQDGTHHGRQPPRTISGRWEPMTNLARGGQTTLLLNDLGTSCS